MARIPQRTQNSISSLGCQAEFFFRLRGKISLRHHLKMAVSFEHDDTLNVNFQRLTYILQCSNFISEFSRRSLTDSF